MNKLIYILFLFLNHLTSEGQSISFFKVLGTNGVVKKENSEKVENLQTGMSIRQNETVILDGGYCGLISDNGLSLELVINGRYTFNDICKKLTTNSKPKVSDKYVSYVLNQLSKPESEDINKVHRKYMDVTGSVERSSKNSLIKLLTYEINNISNKKYTIKWIGSNSIKEYKIEIFNLWGKRILSKLTKGDSMTLDFEYLFKNSENLIFKISDNSNYESVTREILFRYDPNFDKLGLSEGQNGVSYVTNGIICEQNNFYLDALNFYTKSVEINPEVESYKNILERLKKKIENQTQN